jgi:hypothetical protein
MSMVSFNGMGIVAMLLAVSSRAHEGADAALPLAKALTGPFPKV